MDAFRDLSACAGPFNDCIFGRRENWSVHLQYCTHADVAAGADRVLRMDGALRDGAVRTNLDGAYRDGSHAGIWFEVPDEFQGYAPATGVTVEDCAKLKGCDGRC